MCKVGLLVYDYSLYGGAERVALKLANEFAKHYDVHVISCFAEKTTPIMELDVRVNKHVLDKRTKSLTWNAIQLSKRLKEYLRTNDVQLLINITAGINTIGVLGTMNTKVKLIYAEHSNLSNRTYGKKHEFRQWLGSKKADYIVTLTEQDRKAFAEKYHIFEKCKSIHNWYDGEIMSEKYDENSKKIITVGRLAAVKGYDRLIQVAKRVLDKNPTWTWDIYGDGPMYEEVQEMILENGIENHVCLRGNRKDILELYKEYAFFVMTSYYEGLPLVLLEAKASLLPIVSFDCPTGPGEIITDGCDGFLVENGNIDEMVEKINEMIQNSELRKTFSKNSVDKLKFFRKEQIASEWISLINELCIAKE